MSLETPIRPTPSPFVDPESLMMADVLARLEKLDLTAHQRRDLRSAVTSVCRLIDRAPTEVPANINWVHVRLRRVHPAQAKISDKRLKNIRSGVLKALELCGASRDRADWLRPPSPAWSEFLSRIPDKHDAWKLTQLAQYCSAHGVVPEDVTDAHLCELLTALEEETFIDKPSAKVGAMVATWNRLAQQLPGWPSTTLSNPRKRTPWTIPLEAFPASFQEDVDRWINRLAYPDPLSSDGPRKPLRPTTLKHRRFQIQEIASAMVRSGIPIEQVRDLAWLVDVDRLKAGLRYMMARFDDKPTEALHGLVVGVTAIARHHVKVEQDHLDELKRIGSRIKLDADGLRAKNRARLEQLDDDENLARLLHLPARLQTEAKRPGLRAHKRALLIQVALAIEILLHAPMRSGNLSGLSLERHIRRRRVRGTPCLVLSIPGTEVKNGRDLNFELTGEALALFDLYLAEHRPVLLRAPSEYLFPAQNGGPRRPHTLSGLIKNTIYQFTGLEIHTHLFRSIAGKIHCMVHPGDYLTLAHAIGDSLRTAMGSYAQFEQQNAVRHYQASVSEARQQLQAGACR